MTNPNASETNQGKSWVSNFIISFSEWSLRWVPDSMVFVLGLSVAIYIMAWALTPHGPVELVNDWVKGFWVLLTFSMQMCILMITGFTVADSKLIRKGITWMVSLPQTREASIVIYSLILGVLWWMHWGIGMMTSIIMGRELAIAKRGLGLDYRLIAAISYVAIICTNGPSMAAQLLVATPGHFMEKIVGVIPISGYEFYPNHFIANSVAVHCP